MLFLGVPQYVPGNPLLAQRVPKAGIALGSQMHYAGLDRIRHNDTGEPACTSPWFYMYLLRTLNVAECWDRELCEPRGRSYSSKEQVCKKVFDNRLIVLVQVPRCS